MAIRQANVKLIIKRDWRRFLKEIADLIMPASRL